MHMSLPAVRRVILPAALGSLAAALFATVAQAQALTVLPVSVTLAPGEQAGKLTVINRSALPSSVQLRVLTWSQPDDAEQLAPTDEVLISPPIATLAPGASQVVRLVLRHPNGAREGAYRILLDQIPPAASPGTVRIALRLSIPVFVEPAARAAARVTFHVEIDQGRAYLVAVNDGSRHETIRNISLRNGVGARIALANNASPYILAGATRRFLITDKTEMPAADMTLRLTAEVDNGAIDKQVSVASKP